MPSQSSQALVDLFNLLSKYLKAENVGVDLYRLLLEELHSVGAEPTDVTYEEVECPGTVRPAIWCKPLSASPSHVIMYFHGGAFAAGSPASLRKTAAHLAKAAGCYALIIDYRRAPEHQFPKQIEDAVTAYKWLVSEKGISSDRIAFAGDSAGGSLSISTSLKLRDLGLDLPAAIVGFSPWIDMKLTGKSYDSNAKRDVFVSREAVQNMANGYVGSASLDDPLLDILNTDLKGLPPMYLAVGTEEVIMDDAIQLAEHARAAGIDVQLELAEHMQHIYVFMAGNSPEAGRTLSRAGKFIWSNF